MTEFNYSPHPRSHKWLKQNEGDLNPECHFEWYVLPGSVFHTLLKQGQERLHSLSSQSAYIQHLPFTNEK